MKVYLVGGAVRDELLGLPVSEKDWVVVGETDESMKKMGFKSVGKDFPVYLHPTSKEEYALARKERKVSPGHKGFSFETQKNVTLEEDLYRRDITINAIAQDTEGNLIDPFDGQKDIKEKRIKHVSDAFTEDPLRIFRVARFATKLKSLDFIIEDLTEKLMMSISDAKEVEELSFERIWQETEKSLNYKEPSHYFSILKRVNALSPFPKMIDDFEASLERLKVIEKISDKKEFKWAALNLKNKNLDKLSMPKKFKNFLKCAQIFKETMDKEISAKNLLEGLMKINTFRNSDYALEVISFLLKLGVNLKLEINWSSLVKELEKIKPQINEQDSGENIKEKVYKERLTLIEKYLK